MGTWSIEVTRAIFEGKWLSVQYLNKSNETTYFWCSIKDIDPKKKKLTVDVFNFDKSDKVRGGYMFFDSIQRAVVIEGTCYPKPLLLINKITENYQDYRFLTVNSVNERLLSYYMECMFLDNQEDETEYVLVDELDYFQLSEKKMVLNNEHFQKFVMMMKNSLKIKTFGNTGNIETLQLNYLSIESKKHGLVPLVYCNVLVDVEHKSLQIVDGKIFSRRSTVVDGQTRYLIEKYIDTDYEDFVSNFEIMENEFISQITDNLEYDEKINQMPYFFTYSMYIRQNLKDEFDKISKKYENNDLAAPLGNFFGANQENKKRNNKPVLVVNANTNVNQLRVVYNAMNQEVSYVQGPPGTGKTVSITNIIASSLFNELKILVVSNNNQAVDNIIRKIDSIHLVPDELMMPMLRLGSDSHIKETLNKLYIFLMKNYMSKKRKYVNYDRYLLVKNLLKSKMIGISSLLSNYEDQIELSEQIDSLENLIKTLSEDKISDIESKQLSIAGFRVQIENLRQKLPERTISDEDLKELYIDEELMREFLCLYSSRCLNLLFNPENKDILEVLYNEDESERLSETKLLLKSDLGISRLLKIFPIVFSTNISCTKLGENVEVFDLMVMDEASQCNVAVSLIPMARCKRACFIGDQNQLRPVVTLSVNDNERLLKLYDIPPAYDYLKNSIMTTLLNVDIMSKFILLKKHYRCHKKIIDFSNRKYYNSELEIETNSSAIHPLKLIEVSGSYTSNKNTSPSEAKILIEELGKEKDLDNIAVITPFRNQSRLLKEEFAKNGLFNVKVGTIHTFQGDEREKIFISPAITEQTSKGTFNWLKTNQELINVMTTRPRSNLIVVADKKRINTLSGNEVNDFSELIQYIQSNGTTEVSYCKNDIFDNRVTNYRYFNTQVEEQLLQAISHFISTNNRFTVKSRVRISEVISLNDLETKLFLFGKKAKFDFVLYDLGKKPLLVVEIVQSNSLESRNQLEKNEIKKELCTKNNLKLFEIPSDYVRRYNQIREAIIDSLKS